jgi:hypothetical protein
LSHSASTNQPFDLLKANSEQGILKAACMASLISVQAAAAATNGRGEFDEVRDD